MTRKDFIGMKAGNRFRHEEFPEKIFIVKEIFKRDFDRPLVTTVCGKQFGTFELMHRVKDDVTHEQTSELEGCKQLVAILKQRSNHCELSLGSLKRFAGMLSAYFGIEVKDNQAADVMLILKILQLGESDGTA